VYNVHMNRIKRFQQFNTHQQHKSLTSDGIKEQRRPIIIDQLQTLCTNLPQINFHRLEILLKF